MPAMYSNISLNILKGWVTTVNKRVHFRRGAKLLSNTNTKITPLKSCAFSTIYHRVLRGQWDRLRNFLSLCCMTNYGRFCEPNNLLTKASFSTTNHNPFLHSYVTTTERFVWSITNMTVIDNGTVKHCRLKEMSIQALSSPPFQFAGTV